MRFGTLQSIQQQPEREEDDELDFEMPGDEAGLGPEEFDDSEFDDSEFNNEFDDDVEDLEQSENHVADRLMALRAEIDDILADMGYGEDSEFDADEFDGEGEFDDEFSDDEFNFDDEVDKEGDGEDFFDEPQLVGDEAAGDDEAPEGLDMEEEDPNFQGNIRTVAGANLVYKRKEEDGNYEELWIYNVGNDIKKETQIRRAILAGTDIVPSQRESEDGTQRAETFTVGNVQYLKISGLPN